MRDRLPGTNLRSGERKSRRKKYHRMHRMLCLCERVPLHRHTTQFLLTLGCRSPKLFLLKRTYLLNH